MTGEREQGFEQGHKAGQEERAEDLRNRLAREVYAARLHIERASLLAEMLAQSSGGRYDWTQREQVERVSYLLDNLVASTTIPTTDLTDELP